MAGLADRRGVGLCPTEGDRRDHGVRVEHPEGRRDHLAGNLAEERSATREVGRAIGQRHAVHDPRRRVEPEGRVLRVTLGGEVDLPDHRLQSARQCP